MDEEFVLVSKQKIKEYEDKIEDLEHQLEQNNSVEKSPELENKIKELFLSQQELLISEFNELKSRVSVNNFSEFDEKFSNLTNQNKDILQNLQLLVEHLKDSNKVMDNIDELKILIASKHIDQANSDTISQDEQLQQVEISQLEIMEKLQEIELFMSNLRVLLSYVKPSHLSSNN